MVRGLNYLNRDKYKKIIIFRFIHYIFCNAYNFFGKTIQYKFPENLLRSYFKINYFINKKKIILIFQGIIINIYHLDIPQIGDFLIRIGKREQKNF